MQDGQKWPDRLWIARHGQSEANVARQIAYEAAAAKIDIAIRDVDVSLSALGREQARAVGRAFGVLPLDERPNVALVSPYRRAIETSDTILEHAGMPFDRRAGTIDGEPGAYIVDERLREQEFGVLSGLTRMGMQERFADQHELRTLFGKFYHRPPGGESWCDVIMRLRSILGTITREYAGDRVMIVCHSVVVRCFRYLLERWTEEQAMEDDETNDVWNCSLTEYRFDERAGRKGQGGLVLERWYDAAPIEAAGLLVTA